MKEQNSFRKKLLQNGFYSIFISFAVIAIIVVINLLVGSIPAQYINLDLGEQSYFTISDKTKKILENLDKDVKIYYIVQPGAEDSIIEEIADIYDDMSERISVEKIDTAVDPMFYQKYTTEGIPDNSFVVESDLRFQLIPYDSIYVTNVVTDSEGNESTSESFEAEVALTSAIDYVTTEDLPKIYALIGHSEQAINDELLSYIKRENIEVLELSLAVSGEIPEDCSCLVVNAPLKDISDTEQEIITEYVDDGGHLLYIKNINSGVNTRMDQVVAHFGIGISSGTVFDSNPDNMYMNQPELTIPKKKDHVITQSLIDNNVECIMNCGKRIILDDTNGLVEHSVLLVTASTGYLGENQDVEGSMIVAVAAEGPERISGKETKIVVISSEQFLNEEINEFIAEGNYDFILNSIGWMCEHDNSIGIHPKTFYSSRIFMNSTESNILMISVIGIIPVVIILAGIVVWVIRRRR